MARLRLRSPRLISLSRARSKSLHSLLLFAALAVGCALPSVAAAPPIGENAYCGKGNVAQFGDKDGPAELPKACYYTGLDGTPSPGKQIRVGDKADLADAIEDAKCGDTLLLPPGAIYEVKALPSKKCDDQHYITIRTDTPDSKLPPEGTRISPAWAGIASLPGRPPFAQPAGGAAKLARHSRGTASRGRVVWEITSASSASSGPRLPTPTLAGSLPPIMSTTLSSIATGSTLPRALKSAMASESSTART